MELYPHGNYLPANYFTIPISIQCPVCDETSQIVTLIRENGESRYPRYLCGVCHDQFGPRGVCVLRFIARHTIRHAVGGGVVRQIQFFRVDADGIHAVPFATWTKEQSESK